MDTPGKKEVINTLYQSLLLATTTIGYSMLMKRFLKINIGSPSTADLEEILKLGGTVAISNGTLEYLYEQGILPRNIMK
ncbi:hypothetical protein [Bartonella sp. CL50QHWL]|uniref:hypothetical protein n=1 Tax=Bartonella sp. CL50QHWL TaxID=3243536 RepID=UPI0035CF0E55